LMGMGPQVAEPGGGARGRRGGGAGGGVTLGGHRILVRLLGEGRSVREAARATAGTAPHSGRMVGKLLLLRVMLSEASIGGGEALLLLLLLIRRLLLLLQVVLALLLLLRQHPPGEGLLGVLGVEEDPLVLMRGPPVGVGVGSRLLLLLPWVRAAPGGVDVGRGRLLLLLRRITG